MGYGGRECILRALCEVNRQKDSLLDRILKIVFKWVLVERAFFTLLNEFFAAFQPTSY